MLTLHELVCLVFVLHQFVFSLFSDCVCFYLVLRGRASCSGNVTPDVYAANKQEANKRF